MIKEIGGYLELELNKGKHYHENAVYLNTARNCLEYILKIRNYKNIYVPNYTCDAIFEPIKKIDIKYHIYCINDDLEPAIEPSLKNDEAILYINYFGLKNNIVKHLAEKYQKQLIVDNSQAFYDIPLNYIDTFYSARKFFGVPDGAYLYIDKKLNEECVLDVSFNKMLHLVKRLDLGPESGFSDFRNNEKRLENQSIKKMSILTNKLLENIDYEWVRKKRLHNFKYIDSLLSKLNEFKFKISDNCVPMVYPFKTKSIGIREYLIANKIFVPLYWRNNFIDKDIKFNTELAKNIIAIPIDQRYDEKEMNHISQIILKFFKVGLRPLRISDAKISYKLRNDPDIWKYTGKRPDKVISYEIEAEWIKKVTIDTTSIRFAIQYNNEYIGNVQLTDIFRKNAQFHIFIGDKSKWGKGIATIATFQLIAYSKHVLNLSRIYLKVNLNNKPAIRIYQKAGFNFIEGNNMEIDLNSWF